MFRGSCVGHIYASSIGGDYTVDCGRGEDRAIGVFRPRDSLRPRPLNVFVLSSDAESSCSWSADWVADGLASLRSVSGRGASH